jgi:hypothetical protein
VTFVEDLAVEDGEVSFVVKIPYFNIDKDLYKIEE